MTGVNWKYVGCFTALALGVGWLVALPIWLDDRHLTAPFAFPLIAVMMFTPLVAAVITELIVAGTSWRDLPRRLGLWPVSPWRRTLGFTVLGWLVCLLLPGVVLVIAQLAGFFEADLHSTAGAAQYLERMLPEGTEMPPMTVPPAVIIAAMPMAAIINAIPAFGEEAGWRGLLLPALRPLGTWPALLVSGVIWGLWHAPLILLGYNFDRADLVGVALMVGGCIAVGAFLGWLRIRSGTIWPSVVGHGAINAAAGLPVLVMAANTHPDPAATSVLGWIGWIIVGVLMGGLSLAGRVPSAEQWAETARV